jgi:hypothetical protein
MAIPTTRHEVGACGRGHHEVRAYNSATGGGPLWPGDVPMWSRAGHHQDPPTVPQGMPISYRYPSSVPLDRSLCSRFCIGDRLTKVVPDLGSVDENSR